MIPKFASIWLNAVGKFESEARRLGETVRETIDRARNMADVETALREAMERLESALPLPSKSELHQLTARIEALARRIDQLEGTLASGRKSKRPKKK